MRGGARECTSNKETLGLGTKENQSCGSELWSIEDPIPTCEKKGGSGLFARLHFHYGTDQYDKCGYGSKDPKKYMVNYKRISTIEENAAEILSSKNQTGYGYLSRDKNSESNLLIKFTNKKLVPTRWVIILCKLYKLFLSINIVFLL